MTVHIPTLHSGGPVSKTVQDVAIVAAGTAPPWLAWLNGVNSVFVALSTIAGFFIIVIRLYFAVEEFRAKQKAKKEARQNDA